MIRLYIKISENSVCLISRTYSVLCIYHLIIWLNLSVLYSSKRITLPSQSCLVLYSSCANLLHSLIMLLIVTSLLSHNLHLFFCCVYSCFHIVGPYGVILCCKKRFSFSLNVFLFKPHPCFLGRDVATHFCFLLNFFLLVFALSVLFLVAIISFPPHISM